MTYEKSKFELMVKEAERKSLKDMWKVRRHQPLPKRITKMAVGTVLQSSAAREYALKYSKTARDFRGYRRVGEGEDQTVYRKDGEVIKLLYSALRRYPGVKPRDVAETLQVTTDKCKPHMRNIWVPTDFDVVILPVSQEEAVIARQPYMDPRTSYLTMDDLASDSCVPNREKHEFAERMEELHQATGLYVDVLGPNNICLSRTTGGLATLDTIPIGIELQQELRDDGRTYASHVKANIDMLRAI